MQSEMTNCLIYVRALIDSIRLERVEDKVHYTIDGSTSFLGACAFSDAVIIAHHYEQVVMKAAAGQDEELKMMAKKALTVMKDERDRGFEKRIHKRLKQQAENWLKEGVK